VRTLLALALYVLLSSPLTNAEAGEKIRLFKEYWFGQPMTEIRANKEVYQYSEQGVVLPALDTIFAQVKVTILFRSFPDTDDLAAVLIVSEFSDEAFVRIYEALRGGFVAVFMQGSHGSIDVISELSARTHEDVLAAVAKFQREGIYEGRLQITFVEKSAYDAALKAGSGLSSIEDLGQKMPESARTADLILADNTHLSINFLVPKLAAQRLKSNAPPEDF